MAPGFHFFLWLGTLPLLLTGCSQWQPPQAVGFTPASPAVWYSPHLQGGADTLWQQSLPTPQLQQLLAEALANNPALRQQAAQVDQAVYQAAIAGAEALPQLELSLSGGRQRSGGDSRNRVQGQLQLDWQLDLWRELSDISQAAALQALQALADYRQARLSLLADVARGWIELLEAQQQVQLLERRQDNQAQNLDIIESNYRSGLNDSLDVYLARADLAAAQAQLQARDNQLAQASRRLEQLLGRYPAGTLRANGELRLINPAVPAGLPSELLVRRPDLQAGQYALAAANLRLAAAYKARFPRLALTGEWGASSTQLADLLHGDSLIWSAFVNATGPLLDGQRRLNEQQRRQAVGREVAAGLQTTLLSAFTEVENALTAEQQLKRQLQLTEQAADNAIEAEQRAFDQYQAGLTGYITVLESQRRSFDAQSTSLTIRRQRLQTRIELIIALGSEPPPVSAAGQPQKEESQLGFHYP